MNIIKSAILILLAATSVFAEDAQFELEARYEGFDPSLFPELHSDTKNAFSEGVLTMPKATAKAGQTIIMEIFARQVVLPVTLDGKAPTEPRRPITMAVTNAYGHTMVDGRKTANCGVSVEISPEIRNGQILLSGKSTLRQLQQPEAKQQLNAVSFATRETYFSDVVTDGQSITIRVGNGPEDKAQITLKIRKIIPGKAPQA